MPVLSGRAVDAGEPAPFRPLFEALSGYFRRAARAHEDFDELKPTLAALVPEWRRAGEPLYRPSPMELGEALLRLLSRMSEGRGCLVVLEDLHWADPDTAAVLEYVGDNIEGEAVLCVATMRPDWPRAAVQVPRTSSLRRAVSIIQLRRLTGPEVAEMTQLCLHTGAVREDVNALVGRFSDGLPFLVEQILGSAVAAGSLVVGPDGWSLAGGTAPVVPAGFAEVVHRRLALLTEDEARTVFAAAVLGPRFDPDVLAVATGWTTEATVLALRRGVEAQLLAADPVDPRIVTFRHALTRDALLSEMLPYERLHLSRRVLEALQAQDPELAGSRCELAAALAEDVGDHRLAAELLLRAARRAHARGALSTAKPMLDRAWRLAERGDELWLDIGRTLMAVLTDTGEVDRVLEVGEGILARWPRSTDKAEVHLAIARAAAASELWKVATDAVASARRAEDPARRESLDAAADAIAAEVAIGEDRYEEAEALALKALVAGERDGDHVLAGQALLVLGRCYRTSGSSDAWGAFDRVIQIGRDHNLAALRVRGLMERASLDVWTFRSTTTLVAAREEAASAGAVVVTAHIDNFLAWAARDRWDADLADAAVERGLPLARKMRLHVLHGVMLCASAVTAAQRGDRPRMERCLAEAIEVSDHHVDTVALAVLARVTYSLQRDDLPRMSAVLDELMERLRDAPSLPLPERGLWALLRAVEDRDGTEALAAVDHGPGAMHAMNIVYRNYARAVLLGRQGDIAAAGRHMALADGDGTDLEWYQHHARRLVAIAAIADGWGEPVAWLRAGLTYFERRRDEALSGACRSLLAAAGAPLPRRSRAKDVPDDLRARGVTAREVEVLDLLADARSTKEIAALLYLSPKTVERHTSNLVAKLDLNGRSGLVAFAAARVRAPLP